MNEREDPSPGPARSGRARSPGGRARRVLRCAVAIAVLLGLLGVPMPALAAPVTKEDVYRALGVDEIAAEYVILIDTSASMQQGVDLYQGVRESLRSFLAALGANDRVALVTFDREPSVRFHGPAGRNPDPLLAALPTQATGGHTDIGRALEAAIRLIRRSSAPIATIVMFTDGAHDPAPNSPYPFAEGAGWAELARLAADADQEQLLAYAVPLQPDAGIRPLRSVIPDARVLPVDSITALTQELDVPKQASRAAKARTAVGADPGRGIVVEWPTGLGRLSAGENAVELTVRATTERVPLVLSGLRLIADDPDIRLRTDDEPVTLEPGQQVRVPVEIHWDAGARGLAPLDRREVDARVTAHARVDSPWADVLRDDLGVAFAPTFNAEAQPVHGTAQRGSLPLWLLGVVLAALGVAAAVFYRRRAGRPLLAGTLRATSPTSGDVFGEIRLAGRRVPIGPATLSIPGSGAVSAARTPAGTVVRVDYSPTGAPERLESAECHPGRPVILNGVTFEWSGPDDDPDRVVPAGDPAPTSGFRRSTPSPSTEFGRPSPGESPLSDGRTGPARRPESGRRPGDRGAPGE